MQVVVGTDDGIVTLGSGGERGVELEGRRVVSLTRRHDEWWAIVDGSTVVRRDGSGAWHDVATADGTSLTCLLPAPDGAHAGTSDARLLRLFKGSFVPVTGFDEVEGRDSWHAVGSPTPYVRSITKTVTGSLLASVHVGGIPRSANGGASWKPTIDVEADVHQVRAHPVDPQLVAAACAVGFAQSRDAGETWEIHTDGLHDTYLRAVAFPLSAVLVSASEGHRGGKSALYRRPLDGGPFERCREGLPEWLAGNVDTGCLDATRRAGRHSVAAFGDADGTVYASDDDGVSWRTLATDLGTITAVGVA